MSDLFDKLDAPQAEAWRATEGDKIVGTVTARSSRDAGWGEYPIVTVSVHEGSTETPEGGESQPIELPAERAVHAFGVVMTGEVWADGKPGQWRVAEGDTFGVKRGGKATGRNGEYDVYRVLIERPSIADRLDEPDHPSLFSGQ